mgnify:CR=1 FL=1
MYDHSEIEIPENYILKSGNNIPERALTNWSELRAYSGIPEQGPLDEETAKLMIHGYYASVSFVDAQIGRLLKTLEEEDSIKIDCRIDWRSWVEFGRTWYLVQT